MVRKLFLKSLLCSVFVAHVGCDDAKPLRALGATCSDSSECAEGLCGGGICLDPAVDEDLDGLTNGTELTLGTNPVSADSDNDGVDDKEELDTSLGLLDIDGDGIPDVLESREADEDGDCLPNQFDPQNDVENSDLTGLVPIVCRTVGVCSDVSKLTVTCENGAGSGACDYAAVPSFQAEESACDGLDNDCDGVTDDGAPDLDGDGVAGCVDDDDDGDGVEAGDNCPEVENPSQSDSDGDGIGDACDVPTPPTALGVTPGRVGNDPTPDFEGVADPNGLVLLYEGPNCEGEGSPVTADASGRFVGSLEFEPGEHSVTLRGRNLEGLESVCVRSAFGYTLDTTAPGDAAFADATPDSPSTVPTPMLSGTAEPGASVECFKDECDGAVVGSAVVADDGGFDILANLGPGAHDIICRVTDTAGNESPCTKLTTYVVESGELPPPRPVAAPFSPTSPANTHTIAVRGCRPEGLGVSLFTGICSDASAIAATLSPTAEPASGVECPLGFVGFELPVQMPTNTTTAVQALSTTSSGSTSACAVLGVFIHDNEPPARPTVSGFEPPSPSASPIVEVSINAEPWSRVEVFTEFGCGGSGTTGSTDASGKARVALRLDASKPYGLSARATDAAQNTSECGSLGAWVRDANPPQPPIAHPTPLFPSSPSNFSSTPTLSVCSVNISVEVFTASGCTGTAIATLASKTADSACANGFSLSGAVTVAKNQRTVFYGRSTSQTGVSSACVWLGEFTHDDLSPNAPSLIDVAPRSPSRDSSPIVSGIGDAFSTVSVYSAETCTGAILGSGTVGSNQTFEFAVEVIGNANTPLYAQASDLALNSSACTLLMSYVHDDIAPTPPRLPFPLMSPQATPTPVIRGCAGTGALVEVFRDAGCKDAVDSDIADSIDFDCGGTDAASQERAFEVTLLAEENKPIQIYGRSSDAASNRSACVQLATYKWDTEGPGEPLVRAPRPLSWDDRLVEFHTVGESEPLGYLRVLLVPADYELPADGLCSGGEVGSAPVDEDGHFKVDFLARLDEPVHVVFQPLDSLGNEGRCSPPLEVVGYANVAAHDDDNGIPFIDPGQLILFHRPDGSIFETSTMDGYTLEDKGPRALVFAGCYASTTWERAAYETVDRYLDTIGIEPGTELVFLPPKSREFRYSQYFGSISATVTEVGDFQKFFVSSCEVGYFFGGTANANIYDNCYDKVTCVGPLEAPCSEVEYEATLLAVAYDNQNAPLAYSMTTVSWFSTLDGLTVEMPAWKTDFRETDVTLTTSGEDLAFVEVALSQYGGGKEFKVDGGPHQMYANATTSSTRTIRTIPGLGVGWQLSMARGMTGLEGGRSDGGAMRAIRYERRAGPAPASVIVDDAEDFSPWVGPRDAGDFSDPARPVFGLLGLDAMEEHDAVTATLTFQGRSNLRWRFIQPAWQSESIPYPELPGALEDYMPTAYGGVFNGQVVMTDFDFADDYRGAIRTVGSKVLGLFDESSGKPEEYLPAEGFSVRATGWFSLGCSGDCQVNAATAIGK